MAILKIVKVLRTVFTSLKLTPAKIATYINNCVGRGSVADIFKNPFNYKALNSKLFRSIKGFRDIIVR